MRWRGGLGGVVPRLLPHFLSPLVLSLLLWLLLRAFVPSLEPLLLFLQFRLPLRALVSRSRGGDYEVVVVVVAELLCGASAFFFMQPSENSP